MIDSNPVFKENRIGRFTLAKNFLKAYPDEVLETFRRLGILVVRAEMLYWKDGIEYFAYSVFFREVSPGEIPPEYNIVSEKAGTQDWKVRVEEIK